MNAVCKTNGLNNAIWEWIAKRSAINPIMGTKTMLAAVEMKLKNVFFRWNSVDPKSGYLINSQKIRKIIQKYQKFKKNSDEKWSKLFREINMKMEYSAFSQKRYETSFFSVKILFFYLIHSKIFLKAILFNAIWSLF